jgi:Ala-tRNA(Pro) deacylase
MTLQDYLDQMGIAYRMSTHGTAYTSQDLAAQEHISGKQVAKPVAVIVDGRPYLCVLPATHRVDISSLRDRLHASDVALADEPRLREMFPDCEVGAEPPIGRLYGVPTLMDESLLADPQITFQAGTHNTAVTMAMSDYQRAAQPEISSFGRHI